MSEEVKHTPGPWSVWTSCSWRRIGNAGTGQLVCEPIVQRDGHPDLHFRNGGEDGPDAKLIAAAPELLEALQDLSFAAQITGGTAGRDEHLCAAIDKATAAIAKATS